MTINTISIVCPCYREERNIPALLREVRDIVAPLDVEWELVLVNDGSPDNTWQAIVEASEDPHVHGINLSRNFNKEAAMLAGLRAARGDAVVLMDADLQHPPSLIPQMLQTMRDQGVDQVIARRTRDGEGWLRRNLSRLYYRIVRSLMDVELEDGVGDFRMLSRRALDALLRLTEVNRFSKGLFAWIGFPRAVIDYRNVERGEGKSSWTFISLLNYGIDGVIAFNDRPLRLVIHAGIGSVLLGLVYMFWLLIEWVTRGVEAPGYFTTIGMIVLFGGFQLLVLGIIGEYIGRIHNEVKRRPVYIIADETNAPGATE